VIDVFATLTALSVPSGGPPDITIGADIPAAIAAFYAGHGETLVALIQLRGDAATLDYLGLVMTGGAPVLVVGTLAFGVVVENQRFTGGTGTHFGFYQAQNFNFDSASTVNFNGGTVAVLGSGVLFLDTATQLNTVGAFSIDGRSQGRGLIVQKEATADSGAIGAETVMITLPSATYKNGRAFRVMIQQDAVSSAAGNFTVNRIRRGTTTAGAQVALRSFPTWTANTVNDWAVELRNTSGSDVTQQMVLTWNTTAGTSTQKGGTNTISAVEVWDIGIATDYPNRPAI
jgi:hypothetical protein